jgi:hypothetical protein
MEASLEREIIEELHEQLAVLRDQLEGARARESFLLTLLEADRSADRETRLLALLEADRAELRELRQSPRPRPVPPIAASRQPSEIHGRIVEALAAAPGGMTAKQLEAALGTSRPLADILSHLVRKRRVVRVGQGRFALSVEVLVPTVNGVV